VLGDGSLFPLLFLWHGLISFPVSLVRSHYLGTGPGGGQREHATSRHAQTTDWKRTVHIFAMIYLGRMRTTIKQKKIAAAVKSATADHKGSTPAAWKLLDVVRASMQAVIRRREQGGTLHMVGGTFNFQPRFSSSTTTSRLKRRLVRDRAARKAGRANAQKKNRGMVNENVAGKDTVCVARVRNDTPSVCTRLRTSH